MAWWKVALGGLLCVAVGFVATWVAIHWDCTPRPAHSVARRVDPAAAESLVNRVDPTAAESLVKKAVYGAGYGTEAVVCPSPPLEKGRVFQCQLSTVGHLATADLQIVAVLGSLGTIRVLDLRGWGPLEAGEQEAAIRKRKEDAQAREWAEEEERTWAECGSWRCEK